MLEIGSMAEKVFTVVVVPFSFAVFIRALKEVQE
jgi:hypothetical protein